MRNTKLLLKKSVAFVNCFCMDTTASDITQDRIILQPETHSAATEIFFKHFELVGQRPSLQHLQSILAAFGHLPYENLSKIIKLNRHGDSPERLRLPDEVIDDHRRWQLGGTCFSLTYFLQSILMNTGYVCYPVMADMRAGRNVHCAMIVVLDGAKHLVDPGYVLDRPLLIDPQRARVHHTDITGVELVYDAALCSFHLYTFSRLETKWRYTFIDRPTPLPEFLSHWQASFQRNGMHGLCLSRASGDELIYIHSGFMRESSWQGKRNFNIRQTLHSTIEARFGIPAEFVEQAQTALQENLRRERIQTHELIEKE